MKDADLKGLYSDFWEQEDHSQHPLFMDSLPAEVGEDVTLSALQSIAGELSSAEDILLQWKALGNTYFQEAKLYPRRYRTAVEAYSRALEAETNGDPKLEQLAAQVLCNRALCQLKLRQFPEAADDAMRALEKNAQLEKAYHHAASAYLQLELWARGLEILGAAEQQLPAGLSPELAALKAQLSAGAEKSQRAKQAIDRSEAASKSHLLRVLAARQINYIAAPLFDAPLPEPVITPSNLVAWSVLLLLEDAGRSEGVQLVEESQSLAEGVLRPVFAEGLPWDRSQRYANPHQLVCELMIDEDNFVPVPSHLLLLEAVQMCKTLHRFLVLRVRSR